MVSDTGLLEPVQLYKQNPLEKFFIFTIYQIYTLTLTMTILLGSKFQVSFTVHHRRRIYFCQRFQSFFPAPQKANKDWCLLSARRFLQRKGFHLLDCIILLVCSIERDMMTLFGWFWETWTWRSCDVLSVVIWIRIPLQACSDYSAQSVLWHPAITFWGLHPFSKHHLITFC